MQPMESHGRGRGAVSSGKPWQVQSGFEQIDSLMKTFDGDPVFNLVISAH